MPMNETYCITQSLPSSGNSVIDTLTGTCDSLSGTFSETFRRALDIALAK